MKKPKKNSPDRYTPLIMLLITITFFSLADGLNVLTFNWIEISATVHLLEHKNYPINTPKQGTIIGNSTKIQVEYSINSVFYIKEIQTPFKTPLPNRIIIRVNPRNLDLVTARTFNKPLYISFITIFGILFLLSVVFLINPKAIYFIFRIKYPSF